jgi:phospholipid/cholesterol/gamma-HCH transport system substrate-binding protein
MRNQNQIIQLGVFVTVGVLLFLIASYYIGNNQNLFQSTFRVSSLFSNVNGLQPGNNVRYAGIKVGTVEKIVILSDSSLRVDMQLQERVMDIIKKNAVTSIATDGLVGNMIVNISPGKGKAPLVEDGDILESYSRLKTDDIINTLGKTNENLAVLSNDLLTITDQIKNGSGTLSLLLRDPMLAEDLRQSIANLRGATANLSRTGQKVNQMLIQIDSGKGLLGKLVKDTTLFNQVEGLVTHVDTLILAQLDTVMNELQAFGKNIKGVTNELQAFSRDLNDEQGLVGTLLRDSTAARELQQILENVEAGTAKFDQNMEALRENFLFRAYFRKQEKERAKKENRE